jgi:hypothetical protein
VEVAKTMRWHIGPIPETFTPDDSWRTIWEPGPVLLQVLALPVAIASAVAVGWGWHTIGIPQQGQPAGVVLALFLSLIALIAVHELLHAMVHPGWGCSSATIIGLWLRHFLFYAHYEGPLSRDRFLAVFLMPLLIITLLPLALAAVGLVPEPWLFPLAWFSTWNALFSCGDLIGFALIVTQIPRAAIVQNRGWRTYWQPRR